MKAFKASKITQLKKNIFYFVHRTITQYQNYNIRDRALVNNRNSSNSSNCAVCRILSKWPTTSATTLPKYLFITTAKLIPAHNTITSCALTLSYR
jgi:hypothetical protein